MSGGRRLVAAGLGAMWLAFPSARSRADAHPIDGCAAFAPEAAMRSGLPVGMILHVMRAESGDDPRAMSSKGAVGCMQIMLTTWATLTARYRLGSDPFDARMNMIGGALYLSELRARFGIPGAYAAYNAGPDRYIRFATKGLPLPAETVAYAARLGDVGAPIIKADVRARWQEAALFVAKQAGRSREPNVAPPLEAATNDGGADRKTSPSSAVPPIRPDPMFPLPVRNAAPGR